MQLETQTAKLIRQRIEGIVNERAEAEKKERSAHVNYLDMWPREPSIL